MTQIYIGRNSEIIHRGPCSDEDELVYTNMVITDERNGEIALAHAMTSDELKAAFAALPPMEPVKPEHSWRFWCWDLRQNVKDKDPAKFLTWPGVVGTMFVGNAPYIEYELKKLPQKHFKILDDPGIGSPDFYPKQTERLHVTPPVLTSITSTGNLIHQTYHISQWDGWLPELDTIVEVGGGYGAMALICHRLGFRGRYIIYDLPEFSLLQQYYLSNVGIEGVEFATQIDNPTECDLLIGLYSLSEMGLNERGAIMKACPAQSYLLAYGASWGGWDNMAWAMELMKRKSYNWRNWNVGHLPNCWYLVGDKRE